MLLVPDDVKSCQYKMYSLVGSKGFDLLIMTLIMLNCLLLMLEFDGQSEEYAAWLNRFNEYFTFVFTAELGLKLVATGFNYFKDPWNIFDFVIGRNIFNFVIRYVDKNPLCKIMILKF